jgi:molybdate transport system substrate-binding protein
MTQAAQVLAVAGVVLALFSGCRRNSTDTHSQDRPEILLFCGAGLRPSMDVLIQEFSSTEHVNIVVDYAGGEVLLSKIKLSGQGDLYMPGDNRYVDKAADQGLIAFRRCVCYFVPTILVGKGNPKQIRGLSDLTRADVRVGLGDPRAAPIGIVSRELFQKNGIPWERVEQAVKFQSATVNELGIQVQTGALDAVIVWDAVAKQYSQHAEEVPIPLEQNIVSAVDMAVLASARHPEVARRFTEFAGSSRGRQVFEQHGYRVDSPKTAGDGK